MRENLRVVLTVSSLAPRFQKCCRDFPALINTVSVILLPHWNKEALVAHAYHLLKGICGALCCFNRETSSRERRQQEFNLSCSFDVRFSCAFVRYAALSERVQLFPLFLISNSRACFLVESHPRTQSPRSVWSAIRHVHVTTWKKSHEAQGTRMVGPSMLSVHVSLFEFPLGNCCFRSTAIPMLCQAISSTLTFEFKLTEA